MQNKKPYIAIPMGDPAGIGPEIAVKALNDESIYSCCNPIVVGNGEVLARALEVCKINMAVNVVDAVGDSIFDGRTINVINLDNIDVERLVPGKIQAQAGKAAFEYIEKAVELAVNKKVDALATTPINKESLKAAGISHIGHTEILADLTHSKDPLTMFEVRNMRVFFLTRHVSLRKACELVTKEKVLDYIIRCTAALKQLGVNEGTMAVAGLNPHCGEHGLFGDEEVLYVEPAINEAKMLGYNVEGPIGADSVFHLALQGKYNAVLSLYHDQGHIATKTLDFERTISLTIGLPFLRTSVDHGTAFDIAWTGKASAVSMKEAIIIAAKYGLNYKAKTGK